MANLITSFRLLLLFGLVAMAYFAPPMWQLANAPLLIVVFILDGLDGYVARRRHEESLFGSIYDIAADRIVENVLWVALADLDQVPVWVALVFISRGILVDSVRSVGASKGSSPFALSRSPLGRFLVGGRFVRGLYGTVKAVAFAWLFFWQPWSALDPDFWAQYRDGIHMVGDILIYSAVALCVLRAVPVLLEFGAAEGMFFAPRPRRAR